MTPVCASPAPTAAANAATSERRATACACGASDAACPVGRVLLAEDARTLRRLISHTLEGRGIAVTACENGRAALDAAIAAERARTPFDVVLMDVEMPVMTGIDATYELRQQGFKGPIIILTAADERYDLARALCAGADHWLAKPFTGEQLLQAIATVCAAR